MSLPSGTARTRCAIRTAATTSRSAVPCIPPRSNSSARTFTCRATSA
ncbi:hypothetical protein FHG66_05555 [Rubellimicrobium rubrum]|uniref:Uncharacterized protein n=1 Tax=Rubellimicrobium rubrum TaxID=2585369 RepID=A0A5C4N2M0_9RHOB|nr:hypothetical protein FHG66_05555 [Rubellimicrobium rubrum]